MNLEVQMATGAESVAGFADAAERPALPEALARVDRRRAGEVGVEVAAALACAVQEDVVAVEDRVEAGATDAAAPDGDQAGAAGGGDVEPFVDAATTARRVVFADGAADAVCPLDREDVAEVRHPTCLAGDPGRSRDGRQDDEKQRERSGEKRAAEPRGYRQWCSITRSTMLYSFASSALMK